MDHSAYQQEYTPVRRNEFQKQYKTLVFLQQEYPPPSYDYSQSSSPAAEKFLTSDPSTSFGFGGFSQVRSAGNKQLCNFVVFHVFAQLNCQKKLTTKKKAAWDIVQSKLIFRLRARRLKARPNKKILRGQRRSSRGRRNPTLESSPSSYPGEFLAVFKPKINAYLKFQRSTNKSLSSSDYSSTWARCSRKYMDGNILCTCSTLTYFKINV